MKKPQDIEEEEDTQKLLGNNGNVEDRRSVFELEEGELPLEHPATQQPFFIRRSVFDKLKIHGFTSRIDKRYIIALSIPLIFLGIYLLSNLSSWFVENPSDLDIQIPQSQLRDESELRALRILQRQQQGLIRLWNSVNNAQINALGNSQKQNNENSALAPQSKNTSNPAENSPMPLNPQKNPPFPRDPSRNSSLESNPEKTQKQTPSDAHSMPIDPNKNKNSPRPAIPSPVSNVSAPTSNAPSPNLNRSLVSETEGVFSGFMGAFATELLEQLKLNQELQQLLVSPYNASEAAVSANVTADFYGRSYSDVCKARNQSNPQRRTIKWKPKRNKYLVAICISGQMSNHLICLEKHMFFAALLKRVLVLPSPKLDYQYEHALDIDHIKDCLGADNVLTFEEFHAQKKGHLHINKLICYLAKPPCYLDDDHLRKYKSAGWSIDKVESAWPEDAKAEGFPSHPHADEIVQRFKSDDEVIGVGDLFFADVEQQWVSQVGGPLAHKCSTIIRPNRFIVLTAQRFIQTYLGGNFVALHFRRYGFQKFCNVKEESCYFPIPQAANCIVRKIQQSSSPVIYLSTDAPDSETSLLQSLVVNDGQTVPLVKRPSHDSRAKWDALLYRHKLHSDDQVFAMLDKTICAFSSVFVGTSGSTFTDDILRLRREWGKASACDEFLCQGEHPNFQADLD